MDYTGKEELAEIRTVPSDAQTRHSEFAEKFKNGEFSVWTPYDDGSGQRMEIEGFQTPKDHAYDKRLALYWNFGVAIFCVCLPLIAAMFFLLVSVFHDHENSCEDHVMFAYFTAACLGVAGGWFGAGVAVWRGVKTKILKVKNM